MDKIEMNDKLQRKDKVCILGINQKEYGDAKVETNYGKAICLRVEGLAKSIWIPKSAFKILQESKIEPNQYHSERMFYVIEADEWWRDKYKWMFEREIIN